MQICYEIMRNVNFRDVLQNVKFNDRKLSQSAIRFRKEFGLLFCFLILSIHCLNIFNTVKFKIKYGPGYGDIPLLTALNSFRKMIFLSIHLLLLRRKMFEEVSQQVFSSNLCLPPIFFFIMRLVYVDPRAISLWDQALQSLPPTISYVSWFKVLWSLVSFSKAECLQVVWL